MKKLGLFVGAAALVAVSGCLDPDYAQKGPAQGDEVKQVATEPPLVDVEAPKPVEAKPEITPIAVEKQSCTCAPGTKHTTPCACGADDCKCVVTAPEAKPVAAVPAEEETTEYIVQRGDYIAKISKKYNVTIASIRRLNPQIKNDVIRVGQKIKLPGKIDVGEQKAPAPVAAAKTAKPAAKEYKPYTGETKEYVVKSGDTLGAIAYGNGITIRQLKELNSLSTNNIRVGQKLKIPATKVVAEAPKAAAAAPVAEAKAEAKPVVEAKPEAAPAAPAVEPVAAPVAEPAPVVAPAAPAAEEGVTYVVKEGEDLIDLSAKFSLSPSEIRSLNNLGEDDKLTPGQVLKLPAETQL